MPTLPDDTLWLVSFTDDDDRELTAEQIAKALTAGEIVLTTIVWRDGMSDWKPIVEVPELRSVVQRQRIQRKRSTVMGMGGPGTPPPAPARGFGSPRPPAAAAPPGPFARSTSGVPSPPLLSGTAKGSPKGSLAGGLAAPRPAPPPDSEPDSIEDLGSSILESVPDYSAPGHSAPGHSAPTNPIPGGSALGNSLPRLSAPLPRPPMNTLPGRGETRTTLTGPGDFRESPPDSDDEPISIQPDSLPPESLQSDALQTLVAQVPPEAPNSLFNVDSATVSQDLSFDVETPRPRKVERANEDVLRGGKEGSPPSIKVSAPEANTRTSRGPAAPMPPRPVHAPLPQGADPLSDLDDAAFEEKKKGGIGGKLLIAALVVGFCAGAFYLGRQSADPKGTAVTPTAPEAPAPEATQAAAAPEETEEAVPEETAAAEASAEESPEVAANEEPDEEASEPAPDKPQSGESRPSSGSGQSPSKPVAFAREPSVEDLPATQPASQPAVAQKPKEEEPEPESSGPAGPFDKDAAAAALARAASAAGSCRTAGDPSGIAQVSVTFSPSGRATRAVVDGPPFAGTQTGGCIASRMRGSKIPPFTGSRVTVKKRVVIQ